jgi:hypothetical protein
MTRIFINNLGMRVIAQTPDLSRHDRHRFRYVRTPDDLKPFVTLSDAEAAIAGVNPMLKGKRREELYGQWCQWTVQDESLPWHDPTNRVKSFLILDQKQPSEVWLPIGVSILLPLTIDGERHLRLIRKGDHVLSKIRNAATLEGKGLARGSSTRLLLDTWIIRQRPRAPGKPLQRFEHYHWGVGLLLRHIAEFWDPDSRTEFTFLFEPDNPKIAAMLNGLRIFEENRNAVSGKLFLLKYPLDEGKYGPGSQGIIERIMANIRAISSIPIE